MAPEPISYSYDPTSPVAFVSQAERQPTPSSGVALCLSGGGYRAMLFHLGALWRLHELGVLPTLQRISSVSGGSIVAAQLALRWRVVVGASGLGGFQTEVVAPIRDVARAGIDAKAVVLGVVAPGSVSDRVADFYRRHLYGNATLQDLPDEAGGPRFVINASNMQSGALWRFSRPYMGDYRVGRIPHPELSLATAVAASSAFPPVLSPCTLALRTTDYAQPNGEDLHYEPYTTRVILTDGGVYDNLGLETAWKRYRTILVADGGGRMAAEPSPPRDWLRHTKRVLDLVDNQVRALRKRQVVSAYKLPRRAGDRAWRDGAYWGIRTNIADYGLPDPLPCPYSHTMALATIPTRLAKLPDLIQERLINWGYAVCDTAMRRWVLPQAPKPTGFPYPGSGVG